MKKIFTILSVSLLAAGLNAQEVTLSQTNDMVVPESGGILSCNNTDNAIMRLFDLNDYAITGNFNPTKVEAAAIIWNLGYGEASIWNVPGVDYPGQIALSAFEDTGFYGFYSNNTGARVWDWVEFETYDEAAAPLTPSTQFAVVVTGPISNADAGWAESFVPLASDGGFVKSAYFGAPTSECFAGDDDFSVRLDTTTFSDPYSAYLLTVTGDVEGMGIVSLESQALSVYPNPATDVINVTMGDNKIAQTFEIVNLAGQSVHKGKAASSLDVSFLAPGVYVLRVKDNNNVTHMTRIVKK